MVREEGHYTIKRVEKLPKKGNANFLYILKTGTVDKFYRWLSNGTYEDISVGTEVDGSETKIQSGTNVTISGTGTTDDPYIVNSTALGGALEVLDEGNGDGIVVSGRDAANYGNIGSQAVDLGYSFSASSTRGATGTRSNVLGGLNNTAGGSYSTVGGGRNNTISAGNDSVIAGGANGDISAALSAILGGTDATISGAYSSVLGGFNQNISGDYSASAGFSNTISGDWSFAFGEAQTIAANNAGGAGYNNSIKGYGSFGFGSDLTTVSIDGLDNSVGLHFSAGTNNTSEGDNVTTIGKALYGEGNGLIVLGTANVLQANSFVRDQATDQLLVIGNGTTNANHTALVRSNAVELLKNGTLSLPSYGSGTITGTSTYILGVDTNGKIVEETLSSGDVTAASNFSADNTVIFSDGTGKGVKNSAIVNSTYNISASWDGYTAAPDTYGWYGIAGGDSAWVATSYNGTNRVMWSDDNGQTWTNVASSDDGNQWRHVSYGGGVFIALSTSGTNRVMRSTDGGKTWTGVAAAVDTSAWQSVAYGKGVFVAVANSGTNRTMYSTDLGVTWTAVAASNDTNGWNAIAYGEGVFVATASSGTNKTMWSDDYGLTWNGVAAAVEGNQWQSIAYGDGNFVAVSIDGTNRAMISDDLGLTWSSSTTTPSNSNVWRDVIYGNGTWIAVANSGTDKVSRSTDGGDTWTAVTPSDDSNTWRNVAYSDGVFVSVADSGTDRTMIYSPGSNALRNPDTTIEEIDASATGFEYTTVDWVKNEIATIPAEPNHVDTVANLPATPNQGDRAFVTDANATTFHSVVAAGGANFVPVFYDGTDWRIG